MKRVVVVLLAACGPSVGVDDGAADDTTTHDPSTTTSPTGATTQTTATTDPTTVSTTDPTTSDPDTTGLVDSGEDTTSAGFIMDPDGASIGLECDVWAQDCPPSEKCVPASSGGVEWFSRTLCVPVADDPAAVGESCTVQDSPWSGHDDCDLGSVCWYFDDSLEGTCVGQCAGSRANPDCPPAHACQIGSEGTVTLCMLTCDPLAPACGPDRHCTHGEYAGPGELGHFFCEAGPPLFEIRGYAAECDHYGNSCDEGLACVPPAHVPGCASWGCCTTLGTLASPPACPDATQSCIAAYPDGDAPEGLEDLCYCGVES